MIVGYTSGAFDLFHIGHLNLLKNAKGMCDKLVVGVTTDDLVLYRIEIVRSIKYVDAVVEQQDMDKLSMCKKLKANIVFVGDDWYKTEKRDSYTDCRSSGGCTVNTPKRYEYALQTSHS